MSLSFSIIIPTLNQAYKLQPFFQKIHSSFTGFDYEIIVVQASLPLNSKLIENKILVIQSEKGRAKQMNAGAKLVSKDILIFLHDDTYLPKKAASEIAKTFQDLSLAAGAFDLQIDHPGFLYQLISWVSSKRSRLTKIPYGDQAIFIRRNVFEEIGGYETIPLMEDVSLMRRLKREKHSIVILPSKAVTSAKRWKKKGLVYGTFRNWILLLLYTCGIPPHKLAKFYPSPEPSLDKDECLLFFIKHPEKGKVKTRLSKDLPKENIPHLYKCFVEDLMSTLLKTGRPVLIFYSGSEKKQFQDWLGKEHSFIAQKGRNLGERMKNAFEKAFSFDYKKAVIIGSDSPDIPLKTFELSFSKLASNDVVIGPSIDGGYYLLGFRDATFDPYFFEKMQWSHALVFEETIKRMRQKNRSVWKLPLWHDIDNLESLKVVKERGKKTEFKNSKTMKALEKINY